jgi:hypothetical protein
MTKRTVFGGPFKVVDDGSALLALDDFADDCMDLRNVSDLFHACILFNWRTTVNGLFKSQ